MEGIHLTAGRESAVEEARRPPSSQAVVVAEDHTDADLGSEQIGVQLEDMPC